MKLSSQKERLLVALISVYLFCIGLHRGGTQLVIADISNIFHTGTMGVGMLTSIQHIPPLIAPLLLGIVADKIGKKPVVAGSILVFAIGCVVCGLSTSLTLFIIGTIIFSIGSCVSESVSTAVLTDLNEKKSMQYINMSQFMFSFGAVVGPLLIHFFENRGQADWRFPFTLGTFSFVIMAILLAIAKYPGKPQTAAKKDTSAEDEFAQNVSAQPSQTDAAMHRVSKASFIVLFAVLFFCQFVYCGMESSYGSFVPSLMNFQYSDAAISALALSAFWGGMALSRLIFAIVNYKVGFMLRLSFALSGIMMAVLTILNQGMLSVAVSAIIGFTYGPIWSTIGAVAAAKAKEHSGAMIGALMLAGGLGGIVFPAILGAIASRIHIAAGIMMLAVSSIIAAVLCLKVSDRQ